MADSARRSAIVPRRLCLVVATDAGQRPKFAINTDLVRVDGLVERNGTLLSGLAADDFVVALRAFQRDGAPTPPGRGRVFPRNRTRDVHRGGVPEKNARPEHVTGGFEGPTRPGPSNRGCVLSSSVPASAAGTCSPTPTRPHRPEA